MRFFLDRNVPLRLCRILDIFDHENTIEHHDDYFDQHTTDIEWLATLRSWTPIPSVVSGDLRILKNPAEAQALREADLTFFALEKQWTRLAWHDWAWRMVKVWPLISSTHARRPTVYRIPLSTNKIETMGPTSQAGSRRRLE